MQTDNTVIIGKSMGRVEFVCLMALLTSLVALSIDAMLPALDSIGHQLNSQSTQETYLVISLFFVGLSLGQIFFGPFSDVHGRRKTILLGLIIFALGTLVCFVAESITTLLIGRLIQAFGVSGPRIAAMAVIRDKYSGDAMAQVMSFITMVFVLVPMIAPLMGQIVISLVGWRHIFSTFLVFALISGVWFFLRQPETLAKSHRKSFSLRHFLGSCWWLLKHPVVMGNSLAMGAIFGAFLAYLSASQTIFQGIYMTGEWFPAIFALLAFAIGAASFFNGMMVIRFGMKLLCDIAVMCTILFSIVLIVLVLFYDGIPPIVAFIGVLFVGFFFIGVLFGNLNSMAMEPVGHIAGLGAAFIGSLSSLIAVPIASAINVFLSDTLTPIAIGFVIFSIMAWLGVTYAKRAATP